jgi:restriction endonuclease S subunit
VRKGEIEGRLDPNFAHLSKVLKERFQHSNYDFVNFGKCIDYIQYGISSLANSEHKGVPIIRMGNLRGDEWDFSNLKHIELSEKDLKTYKLLDGDLLLNRTNSKELVGKCGVFREQGDWVFASYLIRVRVDENLLLPDFASFFLSSTVGRMQIDCLSRQIIGMTNINAEEIKLIKIPVPPIEVQKQIIEKFEAIYDAKSAREVEAKGLLGGIDAYLLDHLGIEIPITTANERFFYRRLSEITGSRFDANSYRAERLAAIEAVKNGRYSTNKLKFLADFSKTIVSETVLPYVGLENIESSTGNYIETSEKESFGSAVIFKKNQILFPKLRPYLNKVYYAELDGVCSTEFHVLDSKSPSLTNAFLADFLRSQTIVSQTKHLMSGNTLPRLQTEDIENLLIPLPPLEVQEEITAHIRSIRERARELEREAQAEVERAKAEVERMILDKVTRR